MPTASATFANYIYCSSYSPNNIYIGSGTGGKQYAFYSTAGDGSTVNIGLGLDGSATFAQSLSANGGKVRTFHRHQLVYTSMSDKWTTLELTLSLMAMVNKMLV